MQAKGDHTMKNENQLEEGKTQEPQEQQVQQEQQEQHEQHEQQEQQAKRIVINIERYENLIEALEDRYKVRRMVVAIFCVGALLFLALTVIMLSLKSFFPYSDISTTAFGTTTITDEQKQVSYFLFNTADLWANSGIYVEAGDVISVHSSGSSNTAIHKVHKNADENTFRDRNYGPLGERLGRESKRDRLRRQFRIFPNYPSNALVMQVVNPNLDPKTRTENMAAGNAKNFYYIGAQRDNIHIVQEGVLHFAVNDIVLDAPTILKMTVANLAVMADIERDNVEKRVPGWKTAWFNEYIWKKLYPKVDYRDDKLLYRDTSQNETYGIDRTINMSVLNDICHMSREDDKTQVETIQSFIEKAVKNDSVAKRYQILMTDKTAFCFGGYGRSKFDVDSTYKSEMDYYLEHNYKQAWYDDNLGSFLILVEKDNRNRLSHGE